MHEKNNSVHVKMNDGVLIRRIEVSNIWCGLRQGLIFFNKIYILRDYIKK